MGNHPKQILPGSNDPEKTNLFRFKIVLIEDKASGQSLIQDLKIYGFNNIKTIKPSLDKITRFASVTHLFESGIVLLTAKVAFSRVITSEITSFPNGKHDDIVDSISQFLKLNKKRSLLKFQISLDLLAIICQLTDCIKQMPL